MPDNTDFAVLYKTLIDRNLSPDPQKLTRTRDALMALLSGRSPPRGDEFEVDTQRPS